MTKEEVIADLKEALKETDMFRKIYFKQRKVSVEYEKRYASLSFAINELEQQPITWIVGKDNCQVAVRNMSIDKMQKICAIIGEEEQQPSEDCIRELIREFDNKHPALFADYMREFNNHPISEIIEYMWDMHDLIEDIKYRLPNKGGSENK